MPFLQRQAGLEPPLPWWRWPLAMLAGMLLGAGALNYSADGRINVLLVWLLWAGLPFLGSLVSLAWLFRPAKPWLSRFSGQSTFWQPNARQLWWLLSQLQWLWVWFALGIVLVYLLLLLLSDLAFGWSSTLLLHGDVLAGVMQWLSLPWKYFWPAAVPDTAMIELTRFARIEAAETSLQQASGWWPFLLASLVCYNLLPRLGLALFCRWRWRSLQRQQLQLTMPDSQVSTKAATTDVMPIASLDQWQDAPVVSWQLAAANSGMQLGVQDWQQDQQQWQACLADKPKRLLWRVPASRSPVAELADWIQQARQHQIEQAIWLQTDAQTVPERHIASWQAFARQHELVWIRN
ncbi:MAG: DUF2868 domain-containing protein [Alkalimonas sp.]|nr:DUF2868 domain-containing protein [Alkalimonas sp.]